MVLSSHLLSNFYSSLEFEVNAVLCLGRSQPYVRADTVVLDPVLSSHMLHPLESHPESFVCGFFSDDWPESSDLYIWASEKLLR